MLIAACGARTDLSSPHSISVLPDASIGRLVPCVELRPQQGPTTVQFTLPVSLAVVDVFLLLDATGSMTDEIENVRSGLGSVVVPRVFDQIPDAAFGLALAGEFPVPPHADPDPMGGPRPFEMRATITQDPQRIVAALQHIPSWGNRDEPEAQIEALYQIATGEGLEPFIEPSAGCPFGGTGGACFRDDALPVVLMVTDAPFHNGPPDVPPYEPYRFGPPAPHSYERTLEVLRERGILVLGLGARDLFHSSPMPHLAALARDTGAVGEEALAFDIGHAGNEIGQSIVDAIKRLASDVPLDVDATIADVPGDGFDALSVVRGVRAVKADPPAGVRRRTDRAFLGVQPGTRVTFELELDAPNLRPESETRRFGVLVTLRAEGRSRLDTQEVEVVLPGSDGGACGTQ
ncbi:MAG: hypothetical protein MJD61_05735 [Proteobacteria bacterium]|nr:hypothetical protein [Pseudomonadota bacterium]